MAPPRTGITPMSVDCSFTSGTSTRPLLYRTVDGVLKAVLESIRASSRNSSGAHAFDRQSLLAPGL